MKREERDALFEKSTLTAGPHHKHKLARILGSRPNELDDLLVRMRAHVTPVDEQHLVTFVQPRDADVSRHVGANATHNDRQAVIIAAFHVEPEPTSFVRRDPNRHEALPTGQGGGSGTASSASTAAVGGVGGGVGAVAIVGVGNGRWTDGAADRVDGVRTTATSRLKTPVEQVGLRRKEERRKNR